jgi:hypothetical protein
MSLATRPGIGTQIVKVLCFLRLPGERRLQRYRACAAPTAASCQGRDRKSEIPAEPFLRNGFHATSSPFLEA